MENSDFYKLMNENKDKKLYTFEADGVQYINSKNQEWCDEQTQKELAEMNVVFSGKGVIPIKIIYRDEHSNPLIELGCEDDGCIFFHEYKNSFNHSQVFDAHWVRALIEDLESALKIMEDKGAMVYRG